MRAARLARSRADRAKQPPVGWLRLAGYLAPYRARMAVVVVALLLTSAAGLAFPLLIVKLLDSVVGPGGAAQLNWLALLLIGLFLFQSAVQFVQSYNLTFIGERIVLDLRTGVYAKMQQLSLDFHSGRRVGELVSRISNDVTQVRSVLTNSVTQLLSRLIGLVGSVAIVFALNPRLTLFILVLVPLIVGVAFGFGRSFQQLGTRVQDTLAEATVAAEESLQGVRVVKSFAREEYEVARYDAAMRQNFAISLRLALFRSLFGATMAFLGFSALAAVLWFGGQEVLAGRLTLPLLSGFLIYGTTIGANISGLAELYGQLQEALGAIRRVFDILDTQPTVVDAPGATALPLVQGRVGLEAVSFGYEAAVLVLHTVELVVAPGEVLALVGPSGAGKSTLFNLIPRFYDPTAGRVTIDGHDLRDVTQRSLREQIAIVPQETFLFGGTVRENIRYGRLEASDAEIEAAAEAANAAGFIAALPEGYNTTVGERGVKLSGGQRQRIAIARALLKDPRVLLLDEATSALDSESEELVQSALERLMRGRTTVIIAHRLSTVKSADRIAVLDGGRVVALGTHEALMAEGGLYARLYAMQFREGDREERSRE